MYKGKPSPSDSKEAQRVYYHKNRERILLKRKSRKPRAICSEYDKYLDYYYKSKYGILYSDYLVILNSQNGLCNICGLPETQVDTRRNKVKRLAVDHCHTTGKIRGLLCHECNTGLGKFKDNPELLNKAIQYIRKHTQ